MTHEEALKERAATHNQSHIFGFWDELSAHSRERLLGFVRQIDFSLLEQLVAKWLLNPPAAEHFSKVEPIPLIPPIPGRNDTDARAALEAGEEALKAGKIGVFLVAGGQGTRLGFEGPKGSYPIGPLTGKSLFEYHAEKIVNLQRRYDVQFPWYIMVSHDNAQATRDFFEEHDYFGLAAAQMLFIPQQMMPCVDAAGKIIMKAKDEPAMNPGGHGGAIPAIAHGGVLEHARERGIAHLAYFQVDNWAARVVDPHFVGYHTLRNAQMSSKVHLKKSPRESVGVHCLCDGEYRIIEYSELDLYPQLLETNEAGHPLISAGNPAMHILELDFVEVLAADFSGFPWHLALKKVPCIDHLGTPMEPSEPNGYKFETFVFDALRFTKHAPVALTIHHAGEYTPIKQYEGANSVISARQNMNDYWGGWLEAAGVSIEHDEQGHIPFSIEISPRFALTLDEFLANHPELPDKLTVPLSINGDGVPTFYDNSQQ